MLGTVPVVMVRGKHRDVLAVLAELDDHPAVSRLQHRHGEHLIGRPEGDLAVVQA
jgi:hypothetical protein